MAAIGAHQTRAGTDQIYRRRMPSTCPVLADAGARERPLLSVVLFAVIPTGAKRSGGTCSAPLLLYPLFGCHPEDPEGDEGSAVVLFKYPWQPSVRTKPGPALTKSIGARCPISTRLWQMWDSARAPAFAFAFICCHPDRSEAQRRDLLFNFLVAAIPTKAKDPALVFNLPPMHSKDSAPQFPLRIPPPHQI